MQSYPAKYGNLWKWGKTLSIALSLLLMVGFVSLPDSTLRLFWGILIPIIPATFLVSPLIWRSICPIATMNMLGNGWFGRRILPAKSIPATGMAGALLFMLLVPARHFLFNENGISMAATIGLVFLAALVLGAFFEARAGFCNTICPVLPVERLYGQNPMLNIDNPHCSNCTLCTPKGCIDLSPEKSIAKTMGPAHKTRSWIRTPIGVFSAALPGFIAGYFTVSGHFWSDAGWIYLYILSCSIGSYIVIAGSSIFFGWRSNWVLTCIGALSVTLYYGFVAPQMAETLGVAPAWAWAIRACAFALIGIWLGRAIRSLPRESNARHPAGQTRDSMPSSRPSCAEIG